MTAHGEAGTPAPSICSRHTPHNDDAAIALILHTRVRIISPAAGLFHCRWRILERKEWRQRVRLEAFLQVGRRCEIDCGRTEYSGIADPDVEAAPAVKHVVDEGEGGGFIGGVEGVGDKFCIGCSFRKGGDELVRSRVEFGCADVDTSCAMG